MARTVQKVFKNFELNQTLKIDEVSITFFPAGHILGKRSSTSRIKR
jgi:Cft2 family RNA processing exonuclease